jgi:sec-independent protein translocase protein TatB
MFGLGLPEIIVILVVALLVVGPSKLPDLARSLGKAFGDFRRMADEVKETIEEAVIKEETPKEEAAKEEAATEEKPKEETPKTETAKEETTKEEIPGLQTAQAEGFWEHDVYGGYTETGESGQIADAGKVTQEEVPGGDKKPTETKIKEA